LTEPEEKAKELVEKFRYSFDHTDLSVILRISRKEARVHAVDTDEFKELQHLILVADSKIKTIEEAKRKLKALVAIVSITLLAQIFVLSKEGQ